MGANDTDRVGRPKWRSYLLLSRVSNLPTVWTNVLAAAVVAVRSPSRVAVVHVAVAASLFYVGGMFLNDACDHRFDARHRPDRPIPSGDVSLSRTFLIGFTLMASGEAWLAVAGFSSALMWGAALATTIAVYDFWHKGNPIGPLIMGACRGLVYVLAAAAIAGDVSLRVIAAALAMTAYVIAVTAVAKTGPRHGWTIPWLIAGISLVDAAIIAASGGTLALPLVAATGFVLTLGLQRVVPGT